MEFTCKEISISHDEFCCWITFSDRKDKGYVENQSYEEILESVGQYLSLKRSYSEDEFEKDYFTVEFSDFDKSGELKDFKIILSQSQFKMHYKREIILIKLKIDDDAFDDIKNVLRIIVNNRGILKIEG